MSPIRMLLSLNFMTRVMLSFSKLLQIMTMIKNILFDLGGVLYDIRYQNVPEAFARLGFTDFDTHFTQAAQSGPIDLFEEGKISVPEFRDYIRTLTDAPMTDQQIDDAWNAIIIDVPEYRIKMLEELESQYNLYLFSNTNQLNCDKFSELLSKKFGYNIFERYFKKYFFSHEIHLRKPKVEAFQFVLSEAGINPDETLFIDDTVRHIEGARQTGLHTYLLPKGEDVCEKRWLKI